jgi:hypothetical protein
MTELEKYRDLIVGRTLTNLYFTKQDGPHDYMPGITPAYFFSTVMELDNEVRYRFGSDFVVGWNDEEPLITLTDENWFLPKGIVFKGQKVIDLAKDDEYDQLTFHLENGTTIWHTIDYGDGLHIENPDYPFDRNEYEKNVFAAPDSQKPRLTWRQKLSNYFKWLG